MSRPDFLTKGAQARLIPVVALGKKEERATSVVLGGLAGVPCFAQALLATVGQRVGARARIRCYTEVCFAKTPAGAAKDLRPDGVIVLSTGRREWRALIEAKLDQSLDSEQLKAYIALAKANGIDAVITISNDMVGHPTHHPVKLGARDRKNIDLFHWSWMMILTMALLELEEDEFENEAQRFILREVTRFLEHDSSGVQGFTQMNAEWGDLVNKFKSGVGCSATSEAVENTVAAWHQEQRDICLLMTRNLKRHVVGQMSRAHRHDPLLRIKEDCQALVKDGCLYAGLQIEGAADLQVTADLRGGTITSYMRFHAPTDRQRASAAVNWLTRQLPPEADHDVEIVANWPGRSTMTSAPLKKIREEGPDVLCQDKGRMKPTGFYVQIVKHLGGRFSAPRVFIQELEKLVPHFYDVVGQHVRPFQPAPSKVQPAKSPTEETEFDTAELVED